MAEEYHIIEMYKTITNMIDDHILVCNLEGQVVFSNKTIQSYLGYKEIELEEKNLFNLIVDKQINKFKSMLKNTSEKPLKWETFLFQGKYNVVNLPIKVFRQSKLIYVYGNQVYSDHERLQEKLDIEIENAIKIHKTSLPTGLPSTEKISFSSLYIPAQELGGDLFHVFKVDNGLLDDFFEQYVCFIADVSGHGLDSAMLSIFIKDTIRSFFELKHDPGQYLSPKEIIDFLVEQYKKEGYPEDYLICIFIGVFDLKTNELTYCNAGIHKRPLLIRNEKEAVELNDVGLPISAAIPTELLKYQDSFVSLSSPMTLFMMTDGLSEQRVNNKYYEDRLDHLLTQVWDLESKYIVEEIQKDFTEFLENESIEDDITLVVAKLR